MENPFPGMDPYLEQYWRDVHQRLMRHRSVAINCFLFLLSLAVASIGQGQDIVAHRGASHDAPENTLPAFRLAWAQGADAIEGDFYLSQDGRIVCFHDQTAKRLCGVERSIHAMTFAEIQRLDVGKWKGRKWAGTRVPTLGQVLTTIPEDKYMLIEIKCGPEILPALTRQLAASGTRLDQVRIIAFDQQVIAAVRTRLPQMKAYWLVGYKQDEATGRFSPSRAEILETLRQVRASGLDTQANSQVVDAAFVKAIRSAGFELHVWTIDRPDEARHFRQLGVDSITTNRPAWLRAQLAPAKSRGAAWGTGR